MQATQILRGKSIPAQHLLWSGISQELNVGVAFLQLVSGRLALRHSNRVLLSGGACDQKGSRNGHVGARSVLLGPLQLGFLSGTTSFLRTVGPGDTEVAQANTFQTAPLLLQIIDCVYSQHYEILGYVVAMLCFFAAVSYQSGRRRLAAHPAPPEATSSTYAPSQDVGGCYILYCNYRRYLHSIFWRVMLWEGVQSKVHPGRS